MTSIRDFIAFSVCMGMLFALLCIIGEGIKPDKNQSTGYMWEQSDQ